MDGLYAHTPFLERALARQGAVLVVNQSAGEVPALASLQLHSLAARRAYAVENKHVLIGLTRAVHRAMQLLHGGEAGTMQALLRAGVPGLERDLLRTLLPLYVPAMPQTPVLLPDGIRRSVSLFGTGGGRPRAEYRRGADGGWSGAASRGDCAQRHQSFGARRCDARDLGGLDAPGGSDERRQAQWRASVPHLN